MPERSQLVSDRDATHQGGDGMDRVDREVFDVRSYESEDSRVESEFLVALDAYSGPFDVLLNLLAQHELDITELALSQITNEFVQYIAQFAGDRLTQEASAFIDVASILVEAKSAAILPDATGSEPAIHDIEALRDRDLLIARLLQYKAFKNAGAEFRRRMREHLGNRTHPGVTPQVHTATLAPLEWMLEPQDLARLAARALALAPPDHVVVHQLHTPLVDLRHEAGVVRDRLLAVPAGQAIRFDELIADTHSTLEVVARFLAILSFMKQGVVQCKQGQAYDVLLVRWVSDADGTRSVANLESITDALGEWDEQ